MDRPDSPVSLDSRESFEAISANEPHLTMVRSTEDALPTAEVDKKPARPMTDEYDFEWMSITGWPFRVYDDPDCLVTTVPVKPGSPHIKSPEKTAQRAWRFWKILGGAKCRDVCDLPKFIYSIEIAILSDPEFRYLFGPIREPTTYDETDWECVEEAVNILQIRVGSYIARAIPFREHMPGYVYIDRLREFRPSPRVCSPTYFFPPQIKRSKDERFDKFKDRLLELLAVQYGANLVELASDEYDPQHKCPRSAVESNKLFVTIMCQQILAAQLELYGEKMRFIEYDFAEVADSFVSIHAIFRFFRSYDVIARAPGPQPRRHAKKSRRSRKRTNGNPVDTEL